MTSLKFLNNDNYQTYNRDIARECGSINAAVFLSELINRWEYHTDKQELIRHEGKLWFYYTCEKAEDRLVMGRKAQDGAIKKLEGKGWIESKAIGMPAKRHFIINEDKVLEFFGLKRCPNGQTSLSKRDKLECPKGTNKDVQKEQPAPIYKNSKKNSNKEREGGKPPPPPRSRKKPSSEPSKEEKPKERFGHHKNVELTEEDHKKLIDELGEAITGQLIEELGDYMKSSGRSYKCHYATIRSWNRRRKDKDAKETKDTKRNPTTPDATRDYYDNAF